MPVFLLMLVTHFISASLFHFYHRHACLVFAMLGNFTDKIEYNGTFHLKRHKILLKYLLSSSNGHISYIIHIF